MRSTAAFVAAAIAIGCTTGGDGASTSAESTPPAASSAAASASPSTQSWTPADPALMKPIEEMVAESLSIGAIHRIDVNSHTVYMNPAAWTTWEAAERETFTTTMALYCDQHSTAHGRYVDVIDDNTGKKLAHYSPTGYETF